MIGQKLGHFRILEKLGAGGMGEVYRAHDEHLDRDVAIKVLPAGALTDDTARKRFHQEALALSRLNHPNVGTVHEFRSEGGIDYLVMEYVAGTTLSEKLGGRPLPEKEILALGEQLAEGLAAAHEHGVVHRDLKPNNLRVTADGRLKILDFGLAKRLVPGGEATATEPLTEPHGAPGTLPYMAPEQLSGGPTDVRSDLYAAGGILYEMATGQRTFPRDREPMRLLHAILYETPRPPSASNPHVSAGLENIILKCLEKKPEHRYQAAKELVADLRRLSAGMTVVAVQPRRISLRHWWLGGLALGIALAIAFAFLPGTWRERITGNRGTRIRSLAVLPLENLSGDAAQEYLADSMTDALITDMGKISALRVISRTSVMQYKGKHKALGEIAQELSVDAAVEGSILRSGQRVQITARLIEAHTDTQIWSQSYERDLRDVLDLQSEVARAIADQIKIKLTQQERARLASERPANSDAQESYLKGRYCWNQRTPAGLQEGLRYFQQAIAEDPTYALAYAGVADSYILLGNLGVVELNVAVSSAKAAAQKALELDDKLAEAHASLGIASLYDHLNWRQAEQELKLAIELNPNYASAYQWYASTLAVMGRPDDLVRNAERAQILDPLSPIINAYLGRAYYLARRYDEAIRQCRKTLELNSQFPPAHLFLGLAYSQKGQNEEAIAEIQEAVRLFGGRTVRTALAYAYVKAGRKKEAERMLRELVEESKTRSVPSVGLAMIYTAMGDKDQAFQWFEKATEEGALESAPLKLDPMLDSLRADARFAELLKHAGLPPDS